MTADGDSLGDSIKRLSDSFPTPAVNLAAAYLPKGFTSDLLPKLGGLSGASASFMSAAMVADLLPKLEALSGASPSIAQSFAGATTLLGSASSITAAARASALGGFKPSAIAQAMLDDMGKPRGAFATASMVAELEQQRKALGGVSELAGLSTALPAGALSMLGTLSRASVTASFPKFAGFEGARLEALQRAFVSGTPDAPGALGRLSTSLSAASTLGPAFDDLLTVTRRGGPFGFDYGGLQRQVREVDDLLDDPEVAAQVAEPLEEAQAAAGVDEGMLLDMSVFLGIPPATGWGPSATRVLCVTAMGSLFVVGDLAAGYDVRPSAFVSSLLTGVGLWAWFRSFGKGED